MTTFKRFIILLLLLGSFLGGYYAGRRPGSPDIFATARDAYQKTGRVAESLGESARDDSLPSRISDDLRSRFGPAASRGR